ncbi:hypothetical protein [Streptomyces sp. HB2AG]|uniref:hypothetical protein n=1 Tax=Streptomyces sp. HB2AG TaxID=2983400 RepID=UPI0022AA417A|nr:hypothetical protein [Streptomyces sp. HB2AG]MCZ2524607.1 hypothetical protein [Streptomyces sp. HB2AG]
MRESVRQVREEPAEPGRPGKPAGPEAPGRRPPQQEAAGAATAAGPGSEAGPGAGAGAGAEAEAEGRDRRLVLPAFPGTAGYGALRRALTKLGLRHAADVLRPPRSAPHRGFHVVGGLWFPGRGPDARLAVDPGFLEESRNRWQASGDSRAPEAVAVLRTLAAAVDRDPAALHRIVLYQLSCLLVDGEGGPTAGAARALGVHPDDAGLLADAVAAGFPPSGRVRRAAEEIADAWQESRLVRAGQLAAALPAAPADPVLSALLAEVRRATDSVERLMADARALVRRGRPHEAAAAWLAAAQKAVDDPRARTGLLGAAVLAADADAEREGTEGGAPGGDPGTGARDGVRAAVSAGGVRVTWSPAPHGAVPYGGPAPWYRTVRFPEGAPHKAVEVGEPGPGGAVSDPDPPTGRKLRYAVIPLRGDGVAGVPRVTPPVLVRPEVTRPKAVPVPGGIRLDWEVHPEAVEVAAVRRPAAGRGTTAASGAASGPTPVPCGLHGLVDRPLPPGRYHYLVSCAYVRGESREVVWSPGREVTARAVEWPSPVERLLVDGPDTSDAPGGPDTPGGPGGPGFPGGAADVVGAPRLRLSWPEPERGQVRLVHWHGRPAELGEDVSELLPELPPVRVPSPDATAGGDGNGDGNGDRDGDGEAPAVPGDGRPWSGTEFVPRPGARNRITAVSVLGGRAVAGASVLVETPGAVGDLMARRLDGDRIEVWFTWPEPAVLVLLRWEQDGGRRERRIPRSLCLGTGVVLPAGTGECRITVVPLPRPDADFAASGPAVTVLPAVPAHAAVPATAGTAVAVPSVAPAVAVAVPPAAPAVPAEAVTDTDTPEGGSPEGGAPEGGAPGAGSGSRDAAGASVPDGSPAAEPPGEEPPGEEPSGSSPGRRGWWRRSAR